jgi:2-keto-4-pentenoate hydratase/2-oxohepta-3-ene-1,7-dioic acid hydratase in catechol pathway
MKLATFNYADRSAVGVVSGDVIFDTSVISNIPRDMAGLLAAGPSALARLAEASAGSREWIPLSDVHLQAPVRPSKFLAIGLNYADHIAETGKERPEFPTFFNKQVSCVNGPYDPIHKPRVSDKLDYEGELGFVIGKRCRHVPRESAHEVIAGFLVVNDVSVRDWQQKAPTMTLGKSFDSHGPIGPWIVTADEIGDPHSLDLKTWVNAELRQSSNTRHMIFDCYEQVAILSTVCTLEPGDVIATGTCSGVGVMMKPRGYMKIGDVVKVEIERIGYLQNPIIAEPAL